MEPGDYVSEAINFISREQIQDGAVTDFAQFINAAGLPAVTAGTLIFTLNLGAVPLGTLGLIWLTHQSRRLATSTPSVTLQRRRKILGDTTYFEDNGSNNGWLTVDTFTPPTTDYAIRTYSEVSVGAYEELWYRLQYAATAASGSNVVKNIGFTYQRQTL